MREATTRPSRVSEDARGGRWARGYRCDRVCARRRRRRLSSRSTWRGDVDQDRDAIIYFSRSSTGSYPGRWRARALTRRAPHLAPTTLRHTAAVTPTRHTPRPTLTLPPHGMALCLPGRASPVTVAAARPSRLAQRRSTMASPAALVAGRRRLGAAVCAAWSHAASRARTPSRGRLLGRSPSPHRAHPRGGGRRRRHRGGANRRVPFRGHRGQVAEALGGQQDLPHAGTDRHVQAQVLRPRHVPVPQVRRRPTRPPAPRSSSLPNPNPQSPRPPLPPRSLLSSSTSQRRGSSRGPPRGIHRHRHHRAV